MRQMFVGSKYQSILIQRKLRNMRIQRMAPQMVRRKYSKYGIIQPLSSSQTEFVVVPRNLRGHQQLLTIG